MYNMPSRALSLLLRGIQLFCAFIVMALVGNMVANGRSASAEQAASNGTLTLTIPANTNGSTMLGSNSTLTTSYKTHYGNAPIVNFDLFIVAWAMLSLFYLILATINEAFIFHPAIMLGLDILNTFWFFIGGVATAALLGVHSCSNDNYLRSNQITRGAVNMEQRCHEAQASTAFLFFGLIAFIASAVFTFLSSRGTVNLRSISSGPSMSQVSGV